MTVSVLPPGYRFHPTDMELVCYYLKRKIMGKPLPAEAISDIELYKFAPWDLPEQSRHKGKDLVWYFFCIGEKKYSNGSRKNRATDFGFWKTTGKDKPIKCDSQIIALRKTLVFHQGKVPVTRTDWVMHEYRLVNSELAVAGINQDAYVLCKIYEKSGRGPKIGEQYGAPFVENDWEDEGTCDFLPSHPTVEENTCGSQEPLQLNYVNMSEVSDHITPDGLVVPGCQVSELCNSNETSSQVLDQIPPDLSPSQIELDIGDSYPFPSSDGDYLEISDLWTAEDPTLNF